MIPIHEVDVADLTRNEQGWFLAEASALAFPVGAWPRELLLVNLEGAPRLVRHAEILHAGEVHVYRAASAPVLELHVFND
jgi:hypothetical protein